MNSGALPVVHAGPVFAGGIKMGALKRSACKRVALTVEEYDNCKIVFENAAKLYIEKGAYDAASKITAFMNDFRGRWDKAIFEVVSESPKEDTE